jgi:thioredoxin reductase (NADPH)
MDESDDAAAIIKTDVVIVGAGPAGLFAAFEAGVLGLACEVIEAMPRAGGQCAELYPSKAIYDIPGWLSCSGAELVERLEAQARSFDARFYYGVPALDLEAHGERWHLRLADDTVFDCAAVLVAAGNGAFAPQRLSVPYEATLDGRHVHYAVRDPQRFAGRRVVICGGGDSALDWALGLKDLAQVTLLHRRAGYGGAPASADAVRAAAERGELNLCTGTVQGLRAADGRLDAIDVVQAGGGTQTLACDHLIVLFGLVAELGPLAHWGIADRSGRIPVDTSTYETRLRGVFALGDIASYPNKHKLILSAFHEGALALRQAYRYARPQQALVHVHTSNDSRFKTREAAT